MPLRTHRCTHRCTHTHTHTLNTCITESSLSVVTTTCSVYVIENNLVVHSLSTCAYNSCWLLPSNQSLENCWSQDGCRWPWGRSVMKGVMGQQNSCKTLLGPCKVLQLLQVCVDSASWDNQVSVPQSSLECCTELPLNTCTISLHNIICIRLWPCTHYAHIWMTNWCGCGHLSWNLRVGAAISYYIDVCVHIKNQAAASGTIVSHVIGLSTLGGVDSVLFLLVYSNSFSSLPVS